MQFSGLPQFSTAAAADSETGLSGRLRPFRLSSHLRFSHFKTGRQIWESGNWDTMAALPILAVLTMYAAADPVPVRFNEAQVQTGQAAASVEGAASVESVECRTEYVVLWSTKYEEREEQVCVTETDEVFCCCFFSIFYHLFLQVCVTETERVCEIRNQRLCQPTSRQECHTEQVISGVPQRTGFFLVQ